MRQPAERLDDRAPDLRIARRQALADPANRLRRQAGRARPIASAAAQRIAGDRRQRGDGGAGPAGDVLSPIAAQAADGGAHDRGIRIGRRGPLEELDGRFTAPPRKRFGCRRAARRIVGRSALPKRLDGRRRRPPCRAPAPLPPRRPRPVQSAKAASMAYGLSPMVGPSRRSRRSLRSPQCARGPVPLPAASASSSGSASRSRAPSEAHGAK